MPTYLGNWLPVFGFVPAESGLLPGTKGVVDATALAHFHWLPKEFELNIEGTLDGTPFSLSKTIVVGERTGFATFTDLYNAALAGTSALMVVYDTDSFTIGGNSAEYTLNIGCNAIGDPIHPLRNTGSTNVFYTHFEFFLACNFAVLRTSLAGDETNIVGGISIESGDMPYTPGFAFGNSLKDDSGSTRFSSASVTLIATDWLTL
jgi:hypothetical protein